MGDRTAWQASRAFDFRNDQSPEEKTATRHARERDGRVYTKVVESVSAETLMAHIKAHTRKGSVYYTDSFRGISRCNDMENIWQ